MEVFFNYEVMKVKASLPIMIEIRWMVFLFGSPVGNLDQMGDTSSQLVCKFIEEYLSSEVFYTLLSKMQSDLCIVPIFGQCLLSHGNT